jgi:cellulose synthase/poly-beta-1,6-N-acetylglucosamine synthase-like glycosyltransferase
METNEPISAGTPLFSVIIGAYNDWVPLDSCLASLAQQTNSPSFEVIVVDDGSRDAAPGFILRWSSHFPLTIVRQARAGVAAARNRGVQISVGSILLFADADCRFQADCLAVLTSAVAGTPRHNCFQLRLTGDCSTLVGRVEELRLATLQDQLLQPNGCIRYLNTAGFSIRRARVNSEGLLFDPAALRAEDTLVLAILMLDGELPLFVSSAIVQHAISLSLTECMLKGIWSAFQEGKTFDLIASTGVKIRMSHRERLSMLAAMWKASRRQAIGRSAWFALVVRQSLRLIASYVYRLVRGGFRLTHLDRFFLKDLSQSSLMRHGAAGSGTRPNL